MSRQVGLGRRYLRLWGRSAVGVGVSVMVLSLPGVAQAATSSLPVTTPSAASVAAIAAATANVPLPPIPKVSPTVTKGQDPAALLAKAIALITAGDQAVPLQSALSGSQAMLVAEKVHAAQATAAATAANARAASATRAAAELKANATSLGAALRRATLTLYMTGRPDVMPDVTADNGDAVVAAMVGEQVALSPGGILAEQRHAAANAGVAAVQARTAQKAADADAAQAQAASAAASKQVSAMSAELTSLGESTAQTLKAESDTVAQQASTDLASSAGLQFTPTSPVPAPVATTTVALSWLFSELGKPYVYGATGPNSFDCSGLTQFVWSKAGVAIPRVADAQYSYTVPVPLSDLRPGDLVFFAGSDGTMSDPGHVGMYIGGGLMIDAPYTGTVVQVNSIWFSDLIGFGRVHAAGVPVPSRAPVSTSAVSPTLGTLPAQDGPPPGVAPVTEPATSSTTVPAKGSTTTPTTSTTKPTTAVPPSSSTTAAK